MGDNQALPPLPLRRPGSGGGSLNFNRYQTMSYQNDRYPVGDSFSVIGQELFGAPELPDILDLLNRGIPSRTTIADMIGSCRTTLQDIERLPAIHPSVMSSRGEQQTMYMSFISTPPIEKRPPKGRPKFQRKLLGPKECYKCQLKTDHAKCEKHKYLRIGGGYRHSYAYIKQIMDALAKDKITVVRQEIEKQEAIKREEARRLEKERNTVKRRVKVYLRTKSGNVITRFQFVAEDDYQEMKKDKDAAKKLLGLDDGDSLEDFMASKHDYVMDKKGEMVKAKKKKRTKKSKHKYDDEYSIDEDYDEEENVADKGKHRKSKKDRHSKRHRKHKGRRRRDYGSDDESIAESGVGASIHGEDTGVRGKKKSRRRGRHSDYDDDDDDDERSEASYASDDGAHHRKKKKEKKEKKKKKKDRKRRDSDADERRRRRQRRGRDEDESDNDEESGVSDERSDDDQYDDDESGGHHQRNGKGKRHRRRNGHRSKGRYDSLDEEEEDKRRHRNRRHRRRHDRSDDDDDDDGDDDGHEARRRGRRGRRNDRDGSEDVSTGSDVGSDDGQHGGRRKQKSRRRRRRGRDSDSDVFDDNDDSSVMSRNHRSMSRRRRRHRHHQIDDGNYEGVDGRRSRRQYREDDYDDDYDDDVDDGRRRRRSRRRRRGSFDDDFDNDESTHHSGTRRRRRRNRHSDDDDDDDDDEDYYDPYRRRSRDRRHKKKGSKRKGRSRKSKSRRRDSSEDDSSTNSESESSEESDDDGSSASSQSRRRRSKKRGKKKKKKRSRKNGKGEGSEDSLSGSTSSDSSYDSSDDSSYDSSSSSDSDDSTTESSSDPSETMTSESSSVSEVSDVSSVDSEDISDIGSELEGEERRKALKKKKQERKEDKKAEKQLKKFKDRQQEREKKREKKREEKKEDKKQAKKEKKAKKERETDGKDGRREKRKGGKKKNRAESSESESESESSEERGRSRKQQRRSRREKKKDRPVSAVSTVGTVQSDEISQVDSALSDGERRRVKEKKKQKLKQKKADEKMQEKVEERQKEQRRKKKEKEKKKLKKEIEREMDRMSSASEASSVQSSDISLDDDDSMDDEERKKKKASKKKKMQKAKQKAKTMMKAVAKVMEKRIREGRDDPLSSDDGRSSRGVNMTDLAGGKSYQTMVDYTKGSKRGLTDKIDKTDARGMEWMTEWRRLKEKQAKKEEERKHQKAKEEEDPLAQYRHIIEKEKEARQGKVSKLQLFISRNLDILKNAVRVKADGTLAEDDDSDAETIEIDEQGNMMSVPTALRYDDDGLREWADDASLSRMSTPPAPTTSDDDLNEPVGVRRVVKQFRKNPQELGLHLKRVLASAAELKSDEQKKPTLRKNSARAVDERETTIDYMNHYRLVEKSKLDPMARSFVVEDTERKCVLTLQAMKEALNGVPSLNGLKTKHLEYVLKVLDLDDHCRITFKMFAVIGAICERMLAMDAIGQDLIDKSDLLDIQRKMDLYMSMFYCNTNSERGDNFITVETLRIELKAGGLNKAQEEYIVSKMNASEYNEISFLDYMAYIPLFLSMHENIIDNPLDFAEKYNKPSAEIQRDMNPIGLPLKRTYHSLHQSLLTKGNLAAARRGIGRGRTSTKLPNIVTRISGLKILSKPPGGPPRSPTQPNTDKR